MEPAPAALHSVSASLSWLVVGVAVLARVWMAWATHATGEDFLIILRYAENIAAGHGFVYNAGQHVLGSTTPLYTLLLAAATWLHLNAPAIGKASNILADGLTCRLIYCLLARPGVNLPRAGLFASLLYALGSTPISISISGMETALVTCAGTAAILAFVESRWRVLLLLAALLFLLRIDTLLLSVLLIGALALRTRRIPLADVGLALVLALPWVLFSFWYFGSPIPTSLVAKLTVYRGGMGASRADVVAAFATQFMSGWVQKGLTLLFIVGAVRAVRDPSTRLLTPLLWLLLYYGTMLTSHVPAFAWYFLPPWPLYLTLAALGGQAVLVYISVASIGRGSAGQMAAAEPFRASRLRSMWLVALAVVALLGIAHLPSIRRDIAQAQGLEDQVRKPLGLWLRDHARSDERVLLEPIGTIGYYSRRPILDMIGLVSPEVFPSYRTPTPLADIVRRLRPAWLCLRPTETERLHRDAPELLKARYVLIREFRSTNQSLAFLLFHLRSQLTTNTTH